MSLSLVTPPATEPLTLAEVRAHLRLDSTNEEPAPDAPTVALANAGVGGVDAGIHRYRLTFVTADGETEGGVVSSPVVVLDAATNGKVLLTDLPQGGSQVTARKLYRTKSGLDTYLLVATLADRSVTSYVDTVADAALGAGAPSTSTTGDPLLLELIRTAREFVEGLINQVLITQTWRMTLDEFPNRCGEGSARVIGGMRGSAQAEIRLPYPRVQSIDSVTYVDASGTVVTLPTSVYELDAAAFPSRLVLKYGQVWPTSRLQHSAVTITFTAGFGDDCSAVPSAIKSAMRLLVGSWYENRETFVDARYAFETPFAVNALLARYRRQALEMA